MISTILDLAFCILVSSLLDIMAWRERSWHGYSPSSWQSWDWRQDGNGDWWYWPGQTEWERGWQSSWQSYDNQDGRSRSREQQGQQAPRSPDMPPPKGKGKRKGKRDLLRVIPRRLALKELLKVLPRRLKDLLKVLPRRRFTVTRAHRGPKAILTLRRCIATSLGSCITTHKDSFIPFGRTLMRWNAT